MKVFLESDEYGYEEFEADDLQNAFKMITQIKKDAECLKDGVVRKLGILVNA